MTGDARLRVLLVTETVLPQVGGGETQAALLAAGLAARGHQVTLLGRRSISGTARDESFRYRTIRIGPEGAGRWKKWGLLMTLPRVLPRLQDKIDVIVVSGFRLIGFSVLRTVRRSGIPVVLKADSPGEWSGEYFADGLRPVGLSLSNPLISSMLKRRNQLLHMAKAFVAASEMLEQELLAGGVPAERIVRIPNGVDLEHFAPVGVAERNRLREKLGLPSGPLLVNVGRLVRYKGIPELITAWAKVTPLHPSATLILVGGGGNDLDNWEAQAREMVDSLGLSASIRFAGEVPDSAPWLRASDGFVFASVKEAFGLALAEAMSCGLPVITTNVGVAAGCLRDGHDACLVGLNDIDGLALAMDKLLAGLPSFARLGYRARATAAARFGADAVIGQWERLLLRLVGRQVL